MEAAKDLWHTTLLVSDQPPLNEPFSHPSDERQSGLTTGLRESQTQMIDVS
jgi:hypothetical protein